MSSQKRAVAACPNCKKPVWNDHSYPWCIECGERFSEDTIRLIPKLQQDPKPDMRPASGNTATGRAATEPGSEQSESPNQPISEALLSARAIKRYRDAYAIALSIDAQGQELKTLAQALAVIISLLALIAAVMAAKYAPIAAMGAVVVGAIAAAVVYSIIHGYGVQIAAGGQQLLAALDIAVHTSPFLSSQQRAQAMALI